MPLPCQIELARRRPGHTCRHVRLTLDDGVEREYLLDLHICTGSECRTYEPRVHLAHILAQQGHRSVWIAEFTGLPPAAAVRIADAAAHP